MNEIKDNIFDKAYRALTEDRLVIILGDEEVRKQCFENFASYATLRSARHLHINNAEVLKDHPFAVERDPYKLGVGYCNVLASLVLRRASYAVNHIPPLKKGILALNGFDKVENISYFDETVAAGIFSIFTTQWDEELYSHQGIECFISRYTGYISAKTLQSAFVIVVNVDTAPVAYTSFDFLDKVS